MSIPATFPLPEHWHVVVTGFGAFGAHEWNPSRVLAAKLADLAPGRVRFEELPVTWAAAESWSRPDDPATLLLHFGLAGDAKEVRVETLAHNQASGLPDNDGCVVARPDAADALSTTLRVLLNAERLVERLKSTDTGLVMLSEDCGRYVCNATLYHSLRVAADRSVFVHIPPMDEATCGRWAAAFRYALLDQPSVPTVA